VTIRLTLSEIEAIYARHQGMEDFARAIEARVTARLLAGKRRERRLKAWQTSIKGWTDGDCVVAAYTRGGAIAGCFKAANSAGYDVAFGRFRCRRAPECDEWALKQGKPKIVSAEFYNEAAR
jgi:hypothetical protein